MADAAHTPLHTGRPWPLGASCTGTGINFAVWAPDATALELCLFDDDGCVEQSRLPLPACSEGVWHGFLPGGRPGIVYGLRALGPWAPQQGHRFNPAKLLLDPWAHEVVGRSINRLKPPKEKRRKTNKQSGRDGKNTRTGKSVNSSRRQRC